MFKNSKSDWDNMSVEQQIMVKNMFASQISVNKGIDFEICRAVIFELFNVMEEFKE